MSRGLLFRGAGKTQPSFFREKALDEKKADQYVCEAEGEHREHLDTRRPGGQRDKGDRRNNERDGEHHQAEDDEKKEQAVLADHLYRLGVACVGGESSEIKGLSLILVR